MLANFMNQKPSYLVEYNYSALYIVFFNYTSIYCQMLKHYPPFPQFI